ncbi:cation diffusion facilitator family transporter [Halogranum amylolyticum]|uniref:Cation diffusion facilitator family transporter n=1 Tax=Halogranum amylolyticum TaxID=660520 RepID=A0A1H8VSK4_9EURY|nr:cation diffusion facilitator family transporter [Halogranum amylolyticum]SEP18412.1 cation diffusion facilitator family transporter [Halogranum amylolyticum]
MSDPRQAFLKVSWVNVLLNALKISVEGTLGILTGSLALTADAAHSVADLLASGVVLVWGRSVYEDADDSHPHGHNRFEPLSALFVGGVLVLLGLKLLYDASHSILTGVTAEYSIWLIIGLLFALGDMYVCYWYTDKINEKLQLPSLRALAADSLNDLYTTGAALIGVLGMAVGYPILDPIAGGVVSLLVIHQGVDISRENVQYLADSAPPASDQAKIKKRIRDHPAVHGVHDFVAYYSGHTIEVEFHAEVEQDLTLVDAHDLESELRERVREIDPVSDVHVHLDPAGLGEWKDADDSATLST